MDGERDEITRVWIDEGCIGCLLCVGVCPEVFAIPEGEAEAVVLGGAREDSHCGSNREERVRLNAVGLECQAEIRDAAGQCPVQVIHLG